MIRNTHRVGDHLVTCDESGLVRYASQMKRRWDGLLVRPQAWETRHPQEFVRAKADPIALLNVRPEQATEQAMNVSPIFIGETTVPTPTGPASHLFDFGIGEMAVGLTFQVR